MQKNPMDNERFIQKLEKEHLMIQQVFRKLEPIISSGTISDMAYVLEILVQIKGILVNHLNSEDNIFYPDMRKRAVELKQDALLPALDMFIDDMKNISIKIFDFFSRYETKDKIIADEKGFINDIIEIRDMLIKRINSEEKSLYYIYRAYFCP